MGVISSLVVPAGLLVLTALAGHVARPLPDDVEAFLRVYPWIVLVAGLLLGLRFRRGRVVVAVVAIAVADRMLLRFGAGPVGEGAARWAFDATAFLLPLDLGWLGMARERGALAPRGLGRLALIAAQPAVASLIWLSYQPRLVSLLGSRVLPTGFAPVTRMPDLALLAFAGSLAAVAVLCALRRSALEAGFLWALVACFLALESDRSTSLYFATGGLILIVALLENTFAMAFRDPLTGLASRRAFDEAFEKLAAAYVIAMVDVDDFKAVNDRYGHDVGDQILRMVATRIEAAGSGVRAYRVGGEEFALVYVNRSRDEVLIDLENLRAAIAESPFALRSSDRPARRPKRVARRPESATKIGVTVSIGVAESSGRLARPAQVLRAADAALYKAKREGRNRVCV